MMPSSAKIRNATVTAADRSAEGKIRQKEREEEDIVAQSMLEEYKLKIEEEKKMKAAADTALKEETNTKEIEEEDIAAQRMSEAEKFKRKEEKNKKETAATA